MTPPVLYNYFRSSASYRVRIALKLKGIEYVYGPIHLRKGEQRNPDYLRQHPQGLVPALHWTDGHVYTQSLAIMEYINEVHPEPPLLPSTPAGRARVRSLAQMIACDLHPINNLRVLAELRTRFAATDDDVASWYRHWAGMAFDALERRLAEESETGTFCHGETITIADICVVAQMANNSRFDVVLDAYPSIARIVTNCVALPAFRDTAPPMQIDAE